MRIERQDRRRSMMDSLEFRSTMSWYANGRQGGGQVRFPPESRQPAEGEIAGASKEPCCFFSGPQRVVFTPAECVLPISGRFPSGQ
jgi:hypothetical protein